MLLLFLLNLRYFTFSYACTLRRSRRRRCCWRSRGPRSKIPENEHTHKTETLQKLMNKGGRERWGRGMKGGRRINANTFAAKCGRPGFIYTLYCNRACCRRCRCCAAVALSTATTINTCSFVVGIKCLRTHTQTHTLAQNF